MQVVLLCEQYLHLDDFFFFLAKYTILTKLAWGLGLHSTALLFNFLDKKIIY